MSRLAVDDLFYGKPERVRYVAGAGGGYGGSYQSSPHYYSDGDDYSSHRHTGHGVYRSSATGRPILPDVRLSVPMDTARCVQKVKEALDINGVYSVHCDIPNQIVTVSGNIAPQALLKRVKNVKRKSKILSYSSLYNNASHITPHHGYTTFAYWAPTYGSSANDSSHYISSFVSSPPRNYTYHSQHNQHALIQPIEYNDQYQLSHSDHYINYY